MRPFTSSFSRASLQCFLLGALVFGAAACSDEPRGRSGATGDSGQGGAAGGAGQGGAGASGGAGQGGMGGQGGQVDPPECLVATDCPGADDECQTRLCQAGVCSFLYAPLGTPVSGQADGNCKDSVCDGAGSVVTVVNNADVPDDGNQCTKDACQSGVATFTPVSLGGACAAGVCDGLGACVQCNTPADCAGQDSFCSMRTCALGACGATNAPAGTPLPPQSQTFYDCKSKQCDGVGGVVEVDAPLDAQPDGLGCTDDICQGGAVVHPPSPVGVMCNEDFGKVCDGQGTCVECVTDAHCGNWKCVSLKCTQCVTNADCAAWQSCQMGFCNEDNASAVSVFGGGAARPEGMAVDAAGNIYITGWFEGTVDFGGGPLTSVGKDVFLLKLDAQRAHVFSAGFGGAGDQRAHGVALDGQSGVVLVGDFDGTLSFGGPSLVAADRDVFVAKLSSLDGSFVWSKAFTGVGDAEGRAVAVDAGGNIVITGGFDGDISFGGAALLEEGGAASAGGDAFLARLNASGAHLWSKRFGESPGILPVSGQAGVDVAIGEAGEIWALFDFDLSTDLGIGGLISPGGGALLAKFSTMGAPLAQKDAYIRSRFAIDPANYDIVIAGPEGAARYTKTFFKVWETYFPNWFNARGVDVAVDGAGKALMTMGFTSTLTAFGRPFTSAGGYDMLVLAVGADGRHVYSGSYGAAGDQEGTIVAAAASGEALVAGIFSSPFMLAGQALVPAGPQSAFLAVFPP